MNTIDRKALIASFPERRLLSMMLTNDSDWLTCAPYVEVAAPEQPGLCEGGLGFAGVIIDQILTTEEPLAQLSHAAKRLRDLASFLEETRERA